MDLLCVFDQPLQQWRWRIAEVITEFVEDELGVRPEGRRLAFWWKHDLIVRVLSDQIQQLTTHQ